MYLILVSRVALAAALWLGGRNSGEIELGMKVLLICPNKNGAQNDMHNDLDDRDTESIREV